MIKKLLLVLGLAATAYAAALLIWGDAQTLASAQSLCSWTGLQAALLCVLSYVLRGTRWRLWMGHYERPLGVWHGLRVYLAGYSFTPTPGNVGEAMRGLLVPGQPLSTTQSLTIFGAERLADLFCLLLLALPAAFYFFNPIWLGSVLFASFLIAIFLWLVLHKALFNRFLWLQPAWRCLSWRPQVWFLLTLVAWAAQGLAVWLICLQLGMSISLLQATSFYALAMVCGALSMLPAGLGGMEAIFLGLVISTGAPSSVAVAVTLLVRLLTLWLAVGIGLVALSLSLLPRSGKRG